MLSVRRGDQGVTLIEVAITAGLVVVVIATVFSFLVSVQRTVAVGSARAADDSAAKTALTLLEADIRFASNMSVSTDGSTLYVASNSPPCAWWHMSGGNLVEQTTSITTSVAAQGVSGLTFRPSNGYQGLVTITFDVALPQYSSQDKGGSHVIETLSARNMTSAVSVASTPICSLS